MAGMANRNPEVSKHLPADLPACRVHKGEQSMKYGTQPPWNGSTNYCLNFYGYPTTNFVGTN
jgi:hypothetical protein